MRWVLWSIITLVGVVGLLALVGYFLPVAHEASRTAEFNKPPDVVFALIADPETYQSWWDGADVKTAVVKRVPPTTLVTRIVDETQFGGTWTFEITPTPTGARMTITERGEIYNVVFRVLAKYVFGYAGTMEACLAAAKLKLST